MKKEWYRILVLFLSVTAPLYCVLSAFEIQVLGSTFYLYIAGFSIGTYFLFQMKPGKAKNRLIGLILLLLVMIGLLGHSLLWYSFQGLFGQVFLQETESAVRGEFAAIYITVLLCLWEGLWLIWKKNLLATIIPGILGVLPVLFGYLPSGFYAVLLVMFFVMYLTMPVSENVTENPYIPVLAAAVVFLIYLLVLVLVPEKTYQQGKMFSGIRQNIVSLFEQKPVLEEQEEIQEIARGGMNGGTLGQNDGIVYSNQKMLTVSCGVTGNLYLKGFGGSVYENNCWRDLSNEEYGEYTEFFKEMQEKNIDISLESSMLFSMIDRDEQLYTMLESDFESYLDKIIRRKYAVEYEKADGQYCYLPYGSLYAVRDKSSYDGYMRNTKQAYSTFMYAVKDGDYKAISNLVDTYHGENKQLKEYIRWEKEYRTFVHKAYTKVAQSELDTISKAEDTPMYKGDVQEYIKQVQEYFEEKYSYSLMPGKVPEDREFLDYFMNETRTGYCTYFATAATLLFRQAGIPARYVEGYRVDIDSSSATAEEEISEKRKSTAFSAIDTYTMYTVEVLDSSAHAWVEIYVDGYGWIPVEVTPGYEPALVTASNTKVDILFPVQEQDSGEENPMAEVEASEEKMIDESLLPSEEKKQYDTLEAYFADIKTGRIDFEIFFPVLWKEFLRFLWLLCKVAAAMLLLGICFYIPERRVRKHNAWIMTKHEEQTPEQDRQQIMEIYAYLEKLCRFLGIGRSDVMSYSGFAKKAMQYKDYFKEADLNKITRSVQKISFGRGNIGKKEMQEALDAICLVHERSYQELGRIKKLLYTYIWHLR